MTAERARVTRLPRRPLCDERCRELLVHRVSPRALVRTLVHDPDAHERTPRIVHAGTLAIDFYASTVSLGGERLDLTPLELGLVLRLAQTPDALVRSKTLLRDVWRLPPEMCSGDAHTIRVTAARARVKLGPEANRLVTRPWLGYELDTLSPEPPRAPARDGDVSAKLTHEALDAAEERIAAGASNRQEAERIGVCASTLIKARDRRRAARNGGQDALSVGSGRVGAESGSQGRSGTMRGAGGV